MFTFSVLETRVYTEAVCLFVAGQYKELNVLLSSLALHIPTVFFQKRNIAFLKPDQIYTVRFPRGLSQIQKRYHLIAQTHRGHPLYLARHLAVAVRRLDELLLNGRQTLSYFSPVA